MAKAAEKVEASVPEIVLEMGPATHQPRSISTTMAHRYGMEEPAFRATVMATCFPANPPATMEEFAAGMQVAHKLDLNPLVKEVHFARLKGGGIQAIIGVDGWYSMANKHPQFDGCEFSHEWAPPNDKGVSELVSVTCRIFRKDRSRPMEVTEYMRECARRSEAWTLTPSRMLRHRAFGQCARIAFSFAGVMDIEEYSRWQENDQPIAGAQVSQFAPRKSSAEAKRDGSVKRFNEMLKELRESDGAIPCRAIWDKNREFLSELPRGWYETLAEEYSLQMSKHGIEVEIEEQKSMQAAE
jgi:hypothetical protein